MGTQRLVTEITLKDGVAQWDLNGMTRDDWTKMPSRYNAGTSMDPRRRPK
jgi:hypothetical protein